jgi:hypothetical protein
MRGQVVRQTIALNLIRLGFYFTFDHSRSDGIGNSASSQGQILFSVDEDVQYTASGAYAATEPDGRRIYLSGGLGSQTTQSTLFKSSQSSEMTPNESFELGLIEGDDESSREGSLTGTLIADQEYVFSYSAWIQLDSVGVPVDILYENRSSATASGNLSLVFSAVPEPGASALHLTALLGLIGLRRVHTWNSRTRDRGSRPACRS